VFREAKPEIIVFRIPQIPAVSPDFKELGPVGDYGGLRNGIVEEQLR
jgi:hypothetical protein